MRNIRKMFQITFMIFISLLIFTAVLLVSDIVVCNTNFVSSVVFNTTRMDAVFRPFLVDTSINRKNITFIS